jgi:signal peptidase I
MNIKKFILLFSLTFILLLLIGNFRTYLVMGASDLPTFRSGDKVIINRSAYDITFPFSSVKLIPWNKPRRGDMILCYFSRSGMDDYWLKRVIGLPGDTIEIKRQKLYINRKPVRYEILKKDGFNIPPGTEVGDVLAYETGYGMHHTVAVSDAENIISSFGPVVVSPAHYFVLGDNRTNSLDSRFLGLVNRNDIYGKFIFRIYNNK